MLADASKTQTRSPRAALAQLTKPLADYLATESGSAGLLLLATALALAWANSPWSDSYESLWGTQISIEIGDWTLAMDAVQWVNDGLMALFFFVVGLEVRREISVGELTERRRLIVPALGAVGGLVVPSLLYLAVNPTGEEAKGWGIVIGTDTAFVLGVLALVGPRLETQLRVFVLTMTIADDALAVAIIGVVYSDSIDLVALGVAGAALAVIAILSQLRVWQLWIYGMMLVVLWVATLESGVHPSIAGMAAGLVISAYPPRREDVERTARLFRAFRQSPIPSVGRSASESLQRTVSVNERLQSRLHPWSAFVIVPLFAFANAGVDLRGGLLTDALSSPVTWGVVLGLVAGKPIGIAVASLGGRWLGLGSLPRGVQSGQVVGAGAISGIGFTMSLLIMGLAFDSPDLQEEATVGVLLAAALSTVVGWVVFRIAESLLGERSASLPMELDRPVDPSFDHIRGAADARFTLVEYGDFECPFCGAATGIVRELRDHFGDDLCYVFRHLPLTDVHPHAELAAEAAEAAAAQGRFWEMHDILFQHQDELEFEDLVGYAAKLGLDVERFTRDLGEGSFTERVLTDAASAEESGARGTPTFFIGVVRHTGPNDAQTLQRVLQTLAEEPIR
jgi:Na+/H+ antiporter NhaA